MNTKLNKVVARLKEHAAKTLDEVAPKVSAWFRWEGEELRLGPGRRIILRYKDTWGFSKEPGLASSVVINQGPKGWVTLTGGNLARTLLADSVEVHKPKG